MLDTFPRGGFKTGLYPGRLKHFYLNPESALFCANCLNTSLMLFVVG